MDPYGSNWTDGHAPPPDLSNSSSGSVTPSARVRPSASQSTLSHNISDFSDFSQFDSFDVYQSAAALQHSSHDDDAVQNTGASVPSTDDAQSQLRGQASLVSLDTLVFDDDLAGYTKSPVPATPLATGSLSSDVGTPSTPKSTLSRRLSSMLPSRRGSRPSVQPYSPIQEDGQDDGFRESIDMASLVQNAAAMAHKPSGSGKSYTRIDEEDITETGSVPVDLTSLFGPSTSQDEEFVKILQAQEASGKLTLGIGAGFGPSTRLKESDLLDAASVPGIVSPVSPTSTLARSLSKRWPSAPSPLSSISESGLPFGRRELRRKDTVMALAQNEANRRGEIVEVVVEEEEDPAARNGGKDNTMGSSNVDLSVMSGAEGLSAYSGSSLGTAERRQSGLPNSTAQVFYPKPNWRPFSMRWPYLVGLIILSIGLGVAQELLYRASRHKPLVTFHSPSEISSTVYFAIKFAPTLVAVTFGVLWQVTDFEVKRLEAFYQLSKEGGAVADESINVDYVTYIAFLRPIRALYCKHYAVAVSSVLSLLAVSLVPTLSAASMVLTPDRRTRTVDPVVEKKIIIDAVWSRFLTAVYFVVAALGMLLFWLLQRRRSGLLSDVKGIAGHASMAVVSHIMTDFKGMDLASHKDIHSKLKEHRYMLRSASLAPDDDNAISLAEHERYKDYGSHMSQNPHPLMLRAGGCIPYICGVVLFAVLVPVVLFTPANALTDKASWVLTALAVSIKLGWGGLETSVRVMEPYYILWKRHAPAKTLTLDYTAMPFVLVAVQALKNGHMLVFCVGFATILTELLTVLVTSLATVEGHSFIGQHLRDGEGGDVDSGEETALTFWVTLGLVLFILAYMSIVATVVFVRRRRPFLPRQPNTIASVLAYIHQSKMLYDFVGTSKMSNKEMLVKLERAGHTYGLGWFEGRDGKTHCGVDQEELLSSFRLGIDYSRCNKPWQEEVEEWM